MKQTLFVLFVHVCFFYHAQVAPSDPLTTFRLHGTIIDSFSRAPCPYVRVYNHAQQQGVLSDFSGNFELQSCHADDSISFTSPGYRRKYLLAEQVRRQSEIVLDPEASAIEEVIVLADDQRLYRWMDELFSGKQPEHTAKTYFQVETFLNRTQIELVEAYYNATVQGSDIKALAYKNGRIALSSSDSVSFLSTETSKAILQLHLDEPNDYLPETPFEYGPKKMRKQFRLTLNKIYRSGKGHPVYIISFEPRNPDPSAFSGTVWFDTVTKTAEKLVLKALPATNHPFVPISPYDSIVSVDLEINYVFRAEDDFNTIDFIYFNYDLLYSNRERGRYEVQTNVVVHPYDYTTTFIPPRFDRQEGNLSDYRKILALPYNTTFWNKVEHPVSQEDAVHNHRFFEEQHIMADPDSAVPPGNSGNVPFRQYRFHNWSKQRIGIVNTLDSLQPNPAARYAAPRVELYELTAQVYMDVNVFDGKTTVLTATLLDPYHTYYHLPVDSTTNCFLNLYMDIVEIERRKFVAQLDGNNPSPETVAVEYGQLQTAIAEVSGRYFKEVAHGSARRGMEKWNAYVLQELRIDNFGYFRLYDKQP